MTPNATARTTQHPSATAAREEEDAPARGRVAVVGLGYVGLPLALLAKRRGCSVIGYDIDERKIRAIGERSVNYLGTEDADLLLRYGLDASSDARVLSGADVYIVCVPTPVSGDREPDLAPLQSACEAVGRAIGRGALVLIESTVSPGVCEQVGLRTIEWLSGMKGERDFGFAHCPERVNPGDDAWSVGTIPRVLGAIGPSSLARAAEFYRSVLRAPLHLMSSVKEAEAVKMVENAFRDINIAFVNELAMSFDRAGIDLTNVLAGASTKPFGFVAHSPGCGVGGHCIPVDPYYLIRYGRENGFEHDFLVTARRINSRMPSYTVDLLEKELQERGERLDGAEIALLGLAYKRDVPDMRESPALEIREELERRGAQVRSYDPHVPEASTASTLEEALEGAAGAIVATDHAEFRGILPEEFRACGVRVVIDGRNCLPKEAYLAAGIAYRGIGR